MGVPHECRMLREQFTGRKRTPPTALLTKVGRRLSRATHYFDWRNGDGSNLETLKEENRVRLSRRCPIIWNDVRDCQIPQSVPEACHRSKNLIVLTRMRISGGKCEMTFERKRTRSPKATSPAKPIYPSCEMLDGAYTIERRWPGCLTVIHACKTN
jgi:hypothetical protein